MRKPGLRRRSTPLDYFAHDGYLRLMRALMRRAEALHLGMNSRRSLLEPILEHAPAFDGAPLSDHRPLWVELHVDFSDPFIAVAGGIGVRVGEALSQCGPAGATKETKRKRTQRP